MAPLPEFEWQQDPPYVRFVPPRPTGDTGGDAGPSPGPPRRSPMETALDWLESRRRPLLVWHLFWGPRAFGELLRLSVGTTKRVLRQELQALEACGLLCKDQRTRDGRRADYRLTPFGETLKPVLGSLYAWGLYVQTSRPFAASGAAGPSGPADNGRPRSKARHEARSAARVPETENLKENP
jgi:DNA-binding HxlR family transcriptional regulator